MASLGEQSKELFSETSSIGEATTLLFRTYPEDFPHAVSKLSTPISSFFAPTRILITELELPPSGRAALVFNWNSKHYCVAERDVVAGQILGIELFGRMEDDIPIAVAGSAELRSLDSGPVLVSFPLAFGFDPNIATSNWFPVGPYLETRSDTGHGLLSFFSPREPTWRQALLPQWREISKAQLTIKPSREIALRTKSFDSYFGQAISVPVEVEVKSIQGVQLQTETCP